MAKVVKFCAACEEGFAEKFGFCPNCGGALTAYELNPVAAEKASVGAINEVERKASSPVVAENAAYAEKTPEPAPPPAAAAVFSADDDDDDDELLEINDEPEIAPAKVAAAAAVPATVNSFTPDFNSGAFKQNGSSNGSRNNVQTNKMKYDDGLYHIAFV